MHVIPVGFMVYLALLDIAFEGLRQLQSTGKGSENLLPLENCYNYSGTEKL